MRKVIVFFIIAASIAGARAESIGEFRSPWLDPSKAIVIDPYSGNSINWDEMARDKRVVAIIHKATEGLRTDSKYASRKAEAIKRGYLWGSYHLGRRGDPVAQAKHYLATVKPEDGELLALDIESLDPRFMSIDGARKFVEYILGETQRYPVLYVNHTTASKISDVVGKDKVFSKMPLWYARFRSNIPDFPKETWSSYALWQFSSEVNCNPSIKCFYSVPGTKSDMDVNVFFGTAEELKERWPLMPWRADLPSAHEQEGNK